ncbi:MAG: hypothetical protein JST00_24855 [Deltaproteobacteria bacterium]|nr:hypothetical protein [Deltaproteobacteria bacterium]
MSTFACPAVRRDRPARLVAAFVFPALVALAPRPAHADPPQAESTPAATTPAATTPAATTPAPVGPTVELSATDARATIERRVGTTSPAGMPLLETGFFSVGQWEQQCLAPCEVKLDPRYTYRVGGDGLVPTDGFAIPRSGDKVRVDATMGSSTGRVAGALSTAGGASLMALGTLALILTPIFESNDVGSDGFRTGLAVGGVSALSVGALAVGAGLYLWFANGSHARTQVASAK